MVTLIKVEFPRLLKKDVFYRYFIDRSANDLASFGAYQEMTNVSPGIPQSTNFVISLVTETEEKELLMSSIQEK